MRRILGVLLFVAALIAGSTTAIPAFAATRTVSGSVYCTNGQAVTGIWVESSAGGSRWANWWHFPGLKTNAYYSVPLSFSASSSKVSLHVGCGGTPSKWWSTKLTPTFTVVGSRTINAGCTATTAGRSTSCTFPPKGLTTSANQGAAGYCTWGAYEKWRATTGYYPNIGGHANRMDDNAKVNKWRVTTMPAKRAMIVFNTAGYGHVGWVTGISKDSLGRVVIHYTDMNGGTLIPNTDSRTTDFNRFVARTTLWNSSVHRFIHATL